MAWRFLPAANSRRRTSAPTNVIVNRSFVESYLQEPNAFGVRFRYERDKSEAGPRWHQIVGVVRDFPAYPHNFTRDGEPTIYHAVGAGELSPVLGSVLSAGFFVAIGTGALRATPLLLAVAALMTLVALLATLGPARRGVRIQAMEALRAEG